MHAPNADQPKPTGLRRAFHLFEDGAVNVTFAVMTALPLLEIALRKLTGQGIPSSAAVVQHLTLWVTFLGAMLATRDGAHLSVSTAELLPEGRWRDAARLVRHAVAAGVTALLAYASKELIVADAEIQTPVFWDVPLWQVELVMPFALAVMALRQVWGASDRWPGRALALVIAASAFALSLVGEDHLTALRWPIASLLVFAVLLGAPLYVAMSGLAMMLFFTDGTPIAAVPTDTLRLVISPTLPAIPLLTAAGYLLGEGGSATRLITFARAWFGWIPGGMAIVVCLVCALFTAFTGGSGVTILALGGLVLPALIAERYPERFSLGLVTASGSLGLLFPPSLPVILYSVVAQIPDLNVLFIAGLVPGALMILLVLAYGVVVGLRAGTPRTPFDLREALQATWLAKWEVALPIIVGTALLGGLATIVEAAALACAYAIFVEVVVFKDIPLAKLPATVARGATLVGAVLIVLGMALGLTSYLVDAEIPSAIVAWVKEHIETQVGFLLVLNLLLLVLGSVLEIFSAIVVLAPLIVPLGEAYGVDKIHLAIVFLANLELGFLFPPVGLNLFLSASRFNKPLPTMYRNAAPFLAIMAFGVLLVTYVPAMTIGVVEALGYTGPEAAQRATTDDAPSEPTEAPEATPTEAPEATPSDAPTTTTATTG
jgi:tripartite ATP-independent transporter DctM subunit